MATYYWVGGSGTWNNSNTANWSTSSGGAGGAGPPNSADTVNFDTGASAYVVTVASSAAAATINISNNNATLQQNGDVSLGAITLSIGTYNANNYNITATSFTVPTWTSGTRTLTMGSGLWSLSGINYVWSINDTTNFTFNKDTANIIITDSSTSDKFFSGSGLTYNKLTFGAATTNCKYVISTGTYTFSELASIKTVPFTIWTYSSTINVGTWSISGSPGNVVTITAIVFPCTLVKTTSGYVTGVDYLSMGGYIGSPGSDTWYIGANSFVTNQFGGRGIFTTQRADNAVIIIDSPPSGAASTWTVPLDWNNAKNTIHLFGGGGGGAGGAVSGNNRAAGGGGGGGGYTKLTNQTLAIGSSITYQIGTRGSFGIYPTPAGSGGTTSWNSGAATAGGGGAGYSLANASGAISQGGTRGTGSTYNGGLGGAGSTSTVAGTGNGAGGGGGAGGPNGIGGSGGSGFASTTVNNVAGGGGGGNGGGTNGGNASSGTAGNGGNNSTGSGGGTAGGSLYGYAGGGGAGYSGASAGGSSAGNGSDIFGTGGGGGAGGTAQQVVSVTAGSYGGGGGGGGVSTSGGVGSASHGVQGAIIIVYTPISPGNFLAFFEP